ncbi:hypothetical protein EMPS_02073 [Entomortierella parvispora]|uniref:Rab-GAP TBC domain-containing protein n=1 Tax=Entomortierella parvispora TaxID=205924 RepID=A0A9P3H499_9FUNG|nr:hypothetical protein EMPS_02073 [Entomortierella parvispora]
MLLSSPPQQQQQQPRQAYIYHHHQSLVNSPGHHSNSSYSNQNNPGEHSLYNSHNTPSPSKYNKRTLQQYRQEHLDSMSITVEEYEEVLNAEVWVEVNKLRDYARHGISREIRGEVWLYLLGIQEADRSKEVSTQKQKLIDYEQIEKDPNEMTKRVRGEISRYLRKTNIESSRNMPRIFEDVISAFCNHNHRVEYYPAMVNLCAPFIYSVKRECDAFLCFEKMINILDDHFSSRSINEAVASFMTLFRTCIPDLYSYFEEEEVDIKEWAASALQFLLSRELSLENTMRLWDTYFAMPDWIDLHPYFCLAVLKHLKESLEELEQSEIRTMLMRLPSLDMDQIVNEAFNIRHEILERQISDEGL